MNKRIHLVVVLLALSSLAFLRLQPGSAQLQLTDISNQISALSEEITALKKDLEQIQSEHRQTKASLAATSTQLAELTSDYSDSIAALTETVHEYKQAFNQQLIDKDIAANQRISHLDSSLSRQTLYWIIAVLSIALLSVIILRNRISKENEALSTHVREEAIKIDQQLVEVIDKQIHLLKDQIASGPTNEAEVDHSLALKVADEIVRIQTNLSRMDTGTKGIKQLSSSVRRIKDNFEANGYEMVDMLNMPYNEGMKAVASFRPDDSLEAGQQIITRIIKPQINFNGVMIQSAQIEVSQGE